MLGRRQPADLATVDAAFDQAEANARQFGREVAEQIVKRYRAGAIDRTGVDELVEVALEQTAGKAGGVPKVMLRQILTALHQAIAAELATAGIHIAKLQENRT
jgi:hypothetical protein